MAKKKRLSEKHKKFIEEYLLSWNATAAYQATYPRATYESARRLGSQLLTNVDIQAEISARLKQIAMGADEVLARLAEQARASHAPFVRVDEEGFVYFDFSQEDAKNHLHLIKKIKTKRQRLVHGRGEEAEEWEGEWVEVELHDPQRALELIGKHHSLFIDRDDKGKPIQPTIVVIRKDKDE